MAKESLDDYLADDAATEALTLARNSFEDAWDALVIAAGYLERREPLPGNLAEHIAQAINGAPLNLEPKARISAFLKGLHLSAGHRRTRADPIALALEADECFRRGATQEAVFDSLGKKYGVDAKTAERYWRKLRPEIDKLNAEYPPDPP